MNMNSKNHISAFWIMYEIRSVELMVNLNHQFLYFYKTLLLINSDPRMINIIHCISSSIRHPI